MNIWLNHYLMRERSPVLSRPVRRSEVMPDVAPPNNTCRVRRRHQGRAPPVRSQCTEVQLSFLSRSLTCWRRVRVRPTASIGNWSKPSMNSRSLPRRRRLNRYTGVDSWCRSPPLGRLSTEHRRLRPTACKGSQSPSTSTGMTGASQL